MSPLLDGLDGTAGDTASDNLPDLNFRVPFGIYGDRFPTIGTDSGMSHLNVVRSGNNKFCLLFNKHL